MAPILDLTKCYAKRVNRRRFVFFSLILALSSIATWMFADVLWVGGLSIVEGILLSLFAILFAHISVGFVTAVAGFHALSGKGDPLRIIRTVNWNDPPRMASTAIIIPVFNEDVSRVFEGLRVVYRSLEKTGQLDHFDFFILSDSNKPNQWIQEEVAWVELCKQVGGFGRIFYRKRRQSINKKAGNVADFLRRWGKKYRYMVVFDADSMMTGESLVKMVTLMETNPGVGILQTAPRLFRAETLYARLQAFANRLYSPLFLAGLNYWQQAEGNYWGHNAIIRVQPFIEYCSLPELPGSEPFGGRILSHDFVEAALMRQAGWAVWLVPELEGTYEEGPPTLIDSAKRDRRWSQGNLQHTWLLTAKGFRPANRFHLLMGVMSYASSPLWLSFMLLTTLLALSPGLSSGGKGLLGLLSHEWQKPQSFYLFILTMVLLFSPRVLSIVHQLGDTLRAQCFGGRGKVLLSCVLETVLSSLLAPINMVFHSKFVLFTLLGQGVSWVTQRRNASEDGSDWREAILTHGGMTLFGLIWALSTALVAPSHAKWLSPILAGLILSIPLSISLGRESAGRLTRKLGLFLSPEETAPSEELQKLEEHLAACTSHLPPLEPLREDQGLMQAVLDPYINAMHVSLLRQRKPSEESKEWLSTLRQKLLKEGPSSLGGKEKMALLLDAESMIWLHEALWRQSGEHMAAFWRLAMRQYNVLTTAPETALYR